MEQELMKMEKDLMKMEQTLKKKTTCKVGWSRSC